MIIRPVTPDDLPTIQAIYADAVVHGTASFELEPPDLAEMRRRYDALISGGFPYIVAEADGEAGGEADGAPAGTVLGYAYAGAYRTRPAYRGTVEDSVYIAPEAKGQGVGKALLTALIDRAEAAGFRQMIAVIGGSGHMASIRLHEALGFDHIGALKNVGFKHNQWLDTVYLQRPLGLADRAPL